MQYLENYTFDELTIGDQASTERTLVEKDLILFAAASGDVNPIHLDADYAAKTPFKQRIAHGIWSPPPSPLSCPVPARSISAKA